MGMAAPLYYTADMVRAMPDDGNRYEVVYGELLVTPAPRAWHQILVGRLSLTLGNYLHRWPAGVVLTSPADISWGPDVLVQPDVFVVSTEEARTLTWSRMRTLLRVAEVLSPSTARSDRFLKRLRYREAGCRSTGWWMARSGRSRPGPHPTTFPRSYASASSGTHRALPRRSCCLWKSCSGRCEHLVAQFRAWCTFRPTPPVPIDSRYPA